MSGGERSGAEEEQPGSRLPEEAKKKLSSQTLSLSLPTLSLPTLPSQALTSQKLSKPTQSSPTLPGQRLSPQDLPTHAFPSQIEFVRGQDAKQFAEEAKRQAEEEEAQKLADLLDGGPQKRAYRGRTVAMLRRYLRYSVEIGRLPSLVGREFFRSTVTKYRVTTFEDRVIFVHDMENCLRKLDDSSREVLARIVLQEYEHGEAAEMFQCTRMTVHRRLLESLDALSNILVEVGLLDAFFSKYEKPCQGGQTGYFSASDCNESENKVENDVTSPPRDLIS